MLAFRATTYALTAVVLAAPRGAFGSALIPEALRGTWSGNVTQSPYGPLSVTLLDGGRNFLRVSSPDEDGATYFQQVASGQFWKIVASGEIQYCSLGNEGTFEIVPPKAAAGSAGEAGDDTVATLTICWRGPRLPSHRAGCSGCDCARWTLVVDGDTLTSTMMMAAPVVHAQYTLTRTGPPADPRALAAAEPDCQLNNHRGPMKNQTLSGSEEHARRRLVAASAGCPLAVTGQGRRRLLGDHHDAALGSAAANNGTRATGSSGRRRKGRKKERKGRAVVDRMAAGEAAEGPTSAGPVHYCITLNHDLGVRLAYTVPTLPCTPCAIHFTFSMPASENYVSIGFKELAAAYRDFDRMPYDISDYWGMRTSPDAAGWTTPLSGRILAAYIAEDGTGSVRHLTAAGDYVGSVRDVPDDGFFADVRAFQIDGRTSLEFTATLDIEETDWREKAGLGLQRVMWASGFVENGDLGYHVAKRGVAPLSFPGAGTEC